MDVRYRFFTDIETFLMNKGILLIAVINLFRCCMLAAAILRLDVAIIHFDNKSSFLLMQTYYSYVFMNYFQKTNSLCFERGEKKQKELCS